ncbi:MAG: response regulator, partial [Desulfovibrio sp.]|nr:response regulator [Desulfovibrio sp.]
MSDDTAGNMEAAEKEASAQRIRGLEARIAELEKGDIKSRREIVRLQRAVEQEKTVANVKANQYAARTLAQRERDNYLKLLLNNSSDIILFLNKTKRIAFCTDAFVRQTHFADAGAVSGKLLQDVFSEFQDESWFAELLKHAEETVKSGMTSSFEGDIDFGGKGERRRYMIGFTSMNNESGENEGLMILFYDVTAIARAREAAEAASKSKSVFLSNMSHEIRTPMNAIIGMADLMRTDNLDETQREYLAGIRKTSGALLDIINDILDFSKIEAGKMELVQTNYNLFALFDNIRSIAELFAAGKSLRLECDIDETLPRVLYGDEGRVRQVIMNLVSNAVKYTRKGQVCLRLRRTTKNERGYLSVSVEDTGIGIKKEDFPRLFESFEQVDKDKNRGITGTGLGLPITKRLTDLMGGEIFIESEYGKGSVFTILLPLDEGDPLKAEISKGRKRCRVSQDIRILVVDDNALNLTVAQGFLARHGVRAETAESGEEAIEKVCTASYDLVFMDHMMPGMDGIETVHRIRALPGAYYADLPIVALSA